MVSTPHSPPEPKNISSLPGWRIRWLWLAVFAVAFAWVESAVVIDLRRIFFDGDFRFPLVIVRDAGVRVVDPLVKIEFGREIATLVVLAAAGWLAGKNRLQRFAYFLVCFGIWDIFYYIWLKVLTGWPAGLMTWDLLFYVPLPWVGPVLTPVLIAVAMVSFGTWIVYLIEKGTPPRFSRTDVLVLAACALLLVVAFCWDWKNILRLPGPAAYDGIPRRFAWWLYLPVLGFGVGFAAYRIRKTAVPGRGPDPAGRSHEQ